MGSEPVKIHLKTTFHTVKKTRFHLGGDSPDQNVNFAQIIELGTNRKIIIDSCKARNIVSF